jgi:hypothetical protein
LVSEFDDLDRRAMMSIIDIGIKIDIKRRRERNHIVDIITN